MEGEIALSEKELHRARVLEEVARGAMDSERRPPGVKRARKAKRLPFRQPLRWAAG